MGYNILTEPIEALSKESAMPTKRLCAALLLVSAPLFAGKDGMSFRAMPTLSSNPTAGTGAGATAMLIYRADEHSSPSQAIVTGQYTDTRSYNLFAVNKMFFGQDRFQSNTLIGGLFNNSMIDFGEDIPVTPPVEVGTEARFDVTIAVAAQQLLYRIAKHLYTGGQLFYIDQRFNAQNDAGKLFLAANGIEDSVRGGIGATLSYDTRSKSEKFFPRHSQLVTLIANDFPEAWGTKEHFYNVLLNARDYRTGFKSDDVIATQFYAQFSSENTPDGALAALGARNVLRGFVIGQYKTRHMLAAQTEYRYRITGTDFRLTAFGGYASLSGGSKGTGNAANRDRDNGDYYSGGAGVHYILQKEQQVDYRVDFALTNTDDYAVYANINQAF